MDDFIDPEEFPFTEDELYRAERLFADEADAREIAASLAQGGRENRASRLAALAALERGSRDPAEVNYPVLMLSDVFFAQLAALSPELEARVERYFAANRAEPPESRHLTYPCNDRAQSGTPVEMSVAAV